jgi:hypothetical protein
MYADEGKFDKVQVKGALAYWYFDMGDYVLFSLRPFLNFVYMNVYNKELVWTLTVNLTSLKLYNCKWNFLFLTITKCKILMHFKTVTVLII